MSGCRGSCPNLAAAFHAALRRSFGSGWTIDLVRIHQARAADVGSLARLLYLDHGEQEPDTESVDALTADLAES